MYKGRRRGPVTKGKDCKHDGGIHWDNSQVPKYTKI